MSKVYCSFLEVKPLEGCELDPAEVAGAALRCYVRAESTAEAKAKCSAALADDRFEVVRLEWCVADDEVDWENPEDPEGQAHVNTAAASDEVVYGEFHVWPAHGSDT